jgi:hypothetical protein
MFPPVIVEAAVSLSLAQHGTAASLAVPDDAVATNDKGENYCTNCDPYLGSE